MTKLGMTKREIKLIRVGNIAKVADDNLGILSAKYESKGEPGTIGNNPGDPGGKSYGAYQFASNQKTVDKFLDWLKNHNETYWKELIQAKELDGRLYGKNFDEAWVKIASIDKHGFKKSQHDYVKYAYFDQAAKELNERYNFNIENRSVALQNVLWSTAVHHGVTGAVKIFYKAGLDINDEDLIKAVYMERSRVVTYEEMVKIKGETTGINIIDGNNKQEYMMKAEKYGIKGHVMRYFSACDARTQVGVYERFQYEFNEALKMYYTEQNNKTGSGLL